MLSLYAPMSTNFGFDLIRSLIWLGVCVDLQQSGLVESRFVSNLRRDETGTRSDAWWCLPAGCFSRARTVCSFVMRQSVKSNLPPKRDSLCFYMHVWLVDDYASLNLAVYLLLCFFRAVKCLQDSMMHWKKRVMRRKGWHRHYVQSS